MAKSKMAVRKTKKSRQFKLDLKMPSIGSSYYRLFSLAVFSGALVYLCVVIADVWQVTWPVKAVVLQGNTQNITQEQIVKFMQKQPKAGLLAIDLQELQLQAKKMSWIKNVEIRKVWPDKLVFSVDEHQPVALFGNRVLTQQGILIQVKDKTKFNQLAQIDVDKSLQISNEKYNAIWKEFKALKRGLELIDLELNSLQVDDVENWKLSIINGLTLNIGRKSRADRVARFLKVYARIDNNKQLKNIDLRYHNGLAVEWVETETMRQEKLKLKS